MTDCFFCSYKPSIPELFSRNKLGSRRSTRSGTGNWKRRGSSGRFVASRPLEVRTPLESAGAEAQLPVCQRPLAVSPELAHLLMKCEDRMVVDEKVYSTLMAMSTNPNNKLKDGAKCSVIAGTHAGKSGVVTDIRTSKTGHITLTVVQANGERFKTLGKNVSVQSSRSST